MKHKSGFSKRQSRGRNKRHHDKQRPTSLVPVNTKARTNNHSGHRDPPGVPAMKVRRIKIADIVVKNPRELNPVDVAAKAESMRSIGLKTPPTVRKIKGRIELVAGEERLAAAKLLGWQDIDAAFFKGGRTRARIWHHLENLHHSNKFTPLEKAEKLAEVVELSAKLISRQDVGKTRGRPVGIVTQALSALPINGKTAEARRKEIERALKINQLPTEVKVEAKARGLDKKESNLREIAKEKTSEAQLKKIDEIVKRNANKQAAKRNRVKRSKAKAGEPDEKAPAKKHPDAVIFAELKSECSANFRRTWAAASTKVRRRFLREVLKWEGGQPVAAR
jgi:ParB/RepB/Spo0J family partition protein